MGLWLERVNEDLEAAKRLRDSLATAEQVVPLDPTKIDGAFVADRLSQAGQGDEDFEALVASMRDGGQQVPVLVARTRTRLSAVTAGFRPLTATAAFRPHGSPH